MKRYIIASLFLVSGASAQNCDSVLVGIHQSQLVTSSSSKLSTTLQILKKYNSSSYKQAAGNAFSAGLGLPIEGIPVELKFGYSSDSSGKGNWVEKLETYFQDHQEEMSAYTSRLETANADVVKAWRDCVLDRTGVSAYVEMSETADTFILNAKYKPTAMVNAVINNITVSDQIQIVSPPSEWKGKTLPFDGKPFPVLLRWKPNQAPVETFIIVSINGANSPTVKIKPRPVPVSDPLPEKPTVDCDGDYLADSVNFSDDGHNIVVRLGNGLTKTTALPPTYNPFLPQCQMLLADVNGDGLTDLVMIVKSGANYCHVHLAKGDGTFYPLKTFDFRANANAQGNYSAEGTWDVRRCKGRRRDVLHHSPVPGAHDPNVHFGYDWTPSEDGTAFTISAAPQQPCP